MRHLPVPQYPAGEFEFRGRKGKVTQGIFLRQKGCRYYVVVQHVFFSLRLCIRICRFQVE